MPQNPQAATVVKNPLNKLVSMLVDTAGLLMMSGGGLNSKLNIGAAVVVKATPGRIAQLVVIAPGTTSGNLTINDCATTGTAAVANQIFTRLFSDMKAGDVIKLEFPCLTGIVVSAVPGAGTPLFAISFS